MGTRSTTEFIDHGETSATVYRHWDGYPEGAGTDIYRFFDAVRAQTADTRFDDAPYLAAKYVVYLADKFTDDETKPLGFLSVGILPNGKGYGQEFTYRVHCDRLDGDGLPAVECFTADWDTGEVGEMHEIPRPEPATAE